MVGRLAMRTGRNSFPLFFLLDVEMAKAAAQGSTCAVSFQAEKQQALLSSVGSEEANYMANLHLPMYCAAFQAYRIIYRNKCLPFSVS